jgi:hypothetical protein
MDESSPYQPPVIATPPLPPMPPPPVVKTFGILHLVLAGFGLIFSIWGLLSSKVLSMVQRTNPGDPTVVVQRKYLEELWPVTVMGSIFYLGLAALLLVAGLKLVREKADGVMWSNRYAWTSITTKAISLVVAVAYVLPLSNRMMGDIVDKTKGMPAGPAAFLTSFMKSLNSISTVLGPVISCLYPLLALYFLSRPAVKAWVANAR